MTATWQAVVETALGERLVDLRNLCGGDFAAAYRATLKQSGKKIFVKTHANPPPNFFVTESRGLLWLADTQTVNIPSVLGVADSPPYLALAWVEQGQGTRQTEVHFGRQLAALHEKAQPRYGRADGATTGSLAVPNGQCDRWSEFYATQRLLPLVERASEQQCLSASDLRAIESIASRLDSYDVPEEYPALLHGDLWAGNRLIDDSGESWLIDPAVHCGHREFDLGMMALFGGFGDECFAAYHEHYPLHTGWEKRLLLHQLAPLLVHAIKFGGSYVPSVRAVLKKYN